VSQNYDVLIKNTKIVDGSGQPAFEGSIAVCDDKIVVVGAGADQVEQQADRVIDGEGLVTCPGFVDPHSHADMSILTYPRAENLVMQGITTFVGGNCGTTMAPIKDVEYVKRRISWFGSELELDWRTFDEWLSRVEASALALNYVPLVGHNTIRGAVMGEDIQRQATSGELGGMKELVEEAMQSGAFGLSTGLDAALPAHFAATEELVALAKVAERFGGIFCPHTRHHQNQWPAADPSDYGYGIFHAPKGEIITGRYHGLLEAIELSRKANGVPLHIAHMTPAYILPQPHPEFLDRAAAEATLVEVIDKPLAEGLDVTYDVIPWPYSIGRQVPILDAFFSPQIPVPQWLREMGEAAFVEHLKDRAFRDRVREVIQSGRFKFGMVHPITDPYWMDCYEVLTCANDAYAGLTIGQIARQRRPDSIIDAVYDASFEALFDILVEDPAATWALIIDKREYQVLPVFLKHPAGMPCTDTTAFPADPDPGTGMYGTGIPPIAYGLYPQYIRRFVKEEGVLSLEEAIHKATAKPAQEMLGLTGRGILREGAYADVVVMNLERMREKADLRAPTRAPEGIEYVMVNGTLVYEKGAHTGARSGKVLRRNGA
jgi:N-acyl-D-aspartate/D-glutamate deacylase